MIRLFFLLLVLIQTAATAQPPSWRWAAYGANTESALFSRVGIDAAGNVCAAGLFNGTLQLGDSMYRAKGTQNVVVGYFDRNSNIKWSHVVGEDGDIACTAIAMDRFTSDVYVAGTFRSTVRIGDSLYIGKGATDIFLIKYNAKGVLLWHGVYGSPYKDVFNGMAVNSHHQLIVGGTFSNIMTLGKDTLTSNGSSDVLLCQFDSSGTVVWATNFGWKPKEDCYSLAIDTADEIYLNGEFSSNTYFDSIGIQTISSSMFGTNAFVAKCDTLGNLLWAKSYGGIGYGGTSYETMLPGVCTADPTGNFYIGGNFTGGRLIFGSTSNWTVNGGGQWLAKYSPAGNIIWAKLVSPSGYMNAMTCDPEGNLYLAGEYGPGSRFDTTYPYIPAGSLISYAYVARYDGTTSALRWIQTAGDESGAVAFDIAANGPDEVAVCGQFYHGPSIQFGNTTCYNTGTQGNGFVARLRPDAAGVPNTSAAEVQIYPNPARTELHIVQASAAYDRYRLINALGQRVAVGALKDTQQMIRLPQLAAGVYYLELSGDHPAARMPVTIQP